MAPLTTGGLRSRKIDYKKTLAVHKLSDLFDFDFSLNLTRNIVSISSGVEKGEEDVSLTLFVLINFFDNFENLILISPIVPLPNTFGFFCGCFLGKS